LRLGVVRIENGEIRNIGEGTGADLELGLVSRLVLIRSRLAAGMTRLMSAALLRHHAIIWAMP
jgi:hypothetical protein